MTDEPIEIIEIDWQSLDAEEFLAAWIAAGFDEEDAPTGEQRDFILAFYDIYNGD